MPKKQPAPRDRVYEGWVERNEGGPGRVRWFDIPPGHVSQGRVPTVKEVAAFGPDLRRRELDPRFDIRQHSPDGFQWGYGGSGPAQLALALVADATGDDELTRQVYQQFKFQVVARMGPWWRLTAGEVQDAVKLLSASAEA